MDQSPADVLVVGSVAFDTLHLPSGTHNKIAGGAAFYASLAGSIFAPIRLVAIVGDDFPEDILAKLRDRRIDLAGLHRSSGQTFHWEGRYAENLNSRETVKTELNVFADFRPTLPAAFHDSPYVLLGNIDPALQLQVLEQVKQPELVVADTMNYWIEKTPDALRKTLERVDLLVINEEEARQLSCTYNLVEAAKTIHALGPETVVIKRGEYGAMLFHQDRIFCAPAYPLQEVHDPTGAGDSFAGALLGFVASHGGKLSMEVLRQAVIYGSAVASYDVEGVGAQRLLEVQRDDVDARYQDFARLVCFPGMGELV